MKFGKLTLVLILTIGLTCSAAFSADVAKIGIVDFQRILDLSDAGKKAKIDVEKKGREFEDTLRGKGEQIKEEEKNFQRESLVMSAQMREEKKREIRIKINDFNQLQKNLRQELNEYQGRILKAIHVDIRTIAEEIGKKEGYLLILEKRAGGVVYMPSTLDITDRVLQLYNKQFAEKNGSKAK